MTLVRSIENVRSRDMNRYECQWADKSPSPKKAPIFVKTPAQAARGGGSRELRRVGLQDAAAVKVTLQKAAGGFVVAHRPASRAKLGWSHAVPSQKRPWRKL